MKLSQKALGWLGGGVTGLLNGLFGSGGGMVAVPLLAHGGLEPARAHATSMAVILPVTGAICFPGRWIFRRPCPTSSAVCRGAGWAAVCWASSPPPP